MEPEMLQEDVEGHSGLQVAMSSCNSLSLTSTCHPPEAPLYPTPGWGLALAFL